MMRPTVPVRELAHGLHSDVRWAEAGVLERLFAALQGHHMIRISVDLNHIGFSGG